MVDRKQFIEMHGKRLHAGKHGVGTEPLIGCFECDVWSLLATVEAVERERDELQEAWDEATIECGPCSEAGGADRGVRHLPPACGTVDPRDAAGRALAAALVEIRDRTHGTEWAVANDALALARPLHWIEEKES